MEISDFELSSVVHSEAELETFLVRRYEIDGAKVNSYWMTPKGNSYPLVSLLVRDMLAYAWYTPSQDCAGFNSEGTVIWIDQNGSTDFFLEGQIQTVRNCDVITFVQALRVAKEFFRSIERPKSIGWSDL